MNLPPRFTDKFTVVDSGCWEWTAGLGLAEGYGRFHYDGRVGYAHRFAFERIHGDIPAGHVVDHICRNRKCVNPDHLRACTQKENTLARFRKPVELTPGEAPEFVQQLTLGVVA